MIELEKKGKIVIGCFIALSIFGLHSWMGTSTMQAPPVGTTYHSGVAVGYYQVPPQDAEQLINKKENLVVADCSVNGNDFKEGRVLPRAVWAPDASTFYNQHKNVLIYSDSSERSLNYAHDLVGKLYGEIYVLLGGYQAWSGWINRTP